ncbi:MAG: 2Fe-2S iron-sulfur cluster-binding protein, partial [Sphaerochaetaceae bacterium]
MMVVTLLISIGIISLISLFLTILLVIADATIGNYGMVKISINSGTKELEVRGGQPLLKALKQEGVFAPSACGGRGSCGMCKVRVVSGGGAYLPTELPWISDEEKQENFRLSCQFKVKQDVAIVIPEELFLVKEYSAVVERIRDLTHDIKEVRFRLKDPTEITPKAGQYIQLEVPEYEMTDERVYRAYSLASSPDDTGHVELEIRLVPNG